MSATYTNEYIAALVVSVAKLIGCDVEAVQLVQNVDGTFTLHIGDQSHTGSLADVLEWATQFIAEDILDTDAADELRDHMKSGR